MGSPIGNVDTVPVAGNPLDVHDAAENAARQSAPSTNRSDTDTVPVKTSSRSDPNEQLRYELVKQHEYTRPDRSHRRRGGKGGCESKPGCDGSGSAGGGSIFERIALAMGSAMDKKLLQLLEASETVGNTADASNGAEAGKAEAGKEVEGGKDEKSDGLLKASALVTARGQELSAISQAYNSAINSVGQAASNAARKT